LKKWIENLFMKECLQPLIWKLNKNSINVFKRNKFLKVK
jgi:hypothetical protein